MTVLKGKTLTGKSHRSRIGAKPLHRNVLREVRKRPFSVWELYVYSYVVMDVYRTERLSYVIAPPRHTGSSSHQYHSPAELNTPISKATNIPLKPKSPLDTSSLKTQKHIQTHLNSQMLCYFSPNVGLKSHIFKSCICV